MADGPFYHPCLSVWCASEIVALTRLQHSIIYSMQKSEDIYILYLSRCSKYSCSLLTACCDIVKNFLVVTCKLHLLLLLHDFKGKEVKDRQLSVVTYRPDNSELYSQLCAATKCRLFVSSLASQQFVRIISIIIANFFQSFKLKVLLNSKYCCCSEVILFCSLFPN